MANILTYILGSAEDVLAFYVPRLERLRMEGFEIDVCVPDGPAALELESRFNVRTFPRPRDPATLAAAALLVHAHMVERTPILCHGFGTPWAWLAALCADSVGAQACVASIEHHVFVPEDIAGTGGALLAGIDTVTGNSGTRAMRGAYAWLGARVEKYLVNNERDFRILEKESLVDSSRCELILGGRGVDLDVFAPNSDGAPDLESTRESLGLVDCRQVLGAVVPSDDRSRVVLTDLIARTRRTMPYVGWVLIGEEEDVAGVPCVAPGSAAEQFGAYLAADLWIEPSLADWHGLHLMRAAAAGRAAVAFETAASSTVIMQGHTGAFTQRRSSEALFELVESFLGDPLRLRDLGVRARSRAVSRFSRSQIDDQVVRLYDRILRRRFM